jgi:hypothetical protein
MDEQLPAADWNADRNLVQRPRLSGDAEHRVSGVSNPIAYIVPEIR